MGSNEFITTYYFPPKLGDAVLTMYLDIFRLSFENRQDWRLDYFISLRVRVTSSRPTCWYTTTCYRHLPLLLYRMQRRKSHPRAATCNMESFLCRQLVWQAAFQETPLGESKTPDYQAGTHTHTTSFIEFLNRGRQSASGKWDSHTRYGNGSHSVDNI